MAEFKKVLVILSHPSSDSLCASLARAYAEGAGGTLLDLNSLQFDWNLDPRKVAQLEPDLIRAQKLISEAEHLAFVYPLWWGSSPASLKAFIDRTFLTGYAFRYKPNGFPEGLLKGRSARILLTMDSPSWWHRWVYRRSGTTWLRWATLWFSGIKVRKTKEFNGVRKASKEQIESWLLDIRRMGHEDAR